MKPLGNVTQQPDGYTVRFERILPYPIEQVWQAITEPAHLAAWFTDVEFDSLLPGSKMLIRFRDGAKTKSFGKIVTVEPSTRFEFLWENELASWQLYRENMSTRLVFTYSKVDPSYALSVPAGWHVILDQLEAVLGGADGHFPFGGDEPESPDTGRIKQRYRDMMLEQFPALMNK